MLPRISEEGSDREAIRETDLVDALVGSTCRSAEECWLIAGVVRRMFEVLSLLDEGRLAQGEWAFRSFPAFLLARSLLAGMGDPRYRVFESGFWDINDYRIDRQRALIKHAEEIRASLSADLIPIRRVWVAWAWMALDDKFLLVSREDPKSHREGSRGRFVFSGGRVSPEDVPTASMAERLDFFDPRVDANFELARQAFAAALRRELNEELEIAAGDLDSVEPAREPIHYTAIEGAKSAYSASEYWIQPFKVALSARGKTALLRCLALHPDRFDWFTEEELANGVNARGSKAFVDALRQDGCLLHAPDYSIALGNERVVRDAIDIPGCVSEPFCLGVTGRERQVHVPLDDEEIRILGWLAAVRRGDVVRDLAEGVSVASGCGWVLVGHDSILEMLKNLEAKLSAHSLPLLDFHERATRLNATCAYFSRSMLSVEIMGERRGTSYRVLLSRDGLRCALGAADAREVTFVLSEKIGSAVYALTQGDPGPALDDLETVKRMQREVRKSLDEVGARLLVRQVDGVPELHAKVR